MEWKDGKLVRATIRNVSGADGECSVCSGGVTAKFNLPKGKSRTLQPGDFRK